jgi:hypothetical protein
MSNVFTEEAHRQQSLHEQRRQRERERLEAERRIEDTVTVVAFVQDGIAPHVNSLQSALTTSKHLVFTEEILEDIQIYDGDDHPQHLHIYQPSGLWTRVRIRDYALALGDKTRTILVKLSGVTDCKDLETYCLLLQPKAVNQDFYDNLATQREAVKQLNDKKLIKDTAPTNRKKKPLPQASSRIPKSQSSSSSSSSSLSRKTSSSLSRASSVTSFEDASLPSPPRMPPLKRLRTRTRTVTPPRFTASPSPTYEMTENTADLTPRVQVKQEPSELQTIQHIQHVIELTDDSDDPDFLPSPSRLSSLASSSTSSSVIDLTSDGEQSEASSVVSTSGKRKFPRDYHVIDIVRCYQDICDKQGNERNADIFACHFPGVRYVPQTWCPNIARWQSAPASLQQRFLLAGNTDGGLWHRFAATTPLPRAQAKAAAKKARRAANKVMSGSENSDEDESNSHSED